MKSVRPLIRKAVELQLLEGNKKRLAIDFGVGAGTETAYLLAHGYQTIAIDNFEEFLTELRLHEVNRPYLSELTTIQGNFEELSWELIPQVDLFIASHSLYFIQREEFQRVWNKIVPHIKVGGLFAGELSTHQILNQQIEGYFVDEPLQSVPFLTEPEIRALFNDFELIHFSPASSLYDQQDEFQKNKETIYSIMGRKT